MKKLQQMKFQQLVTRPKQSNLPKDFELIEGILIGVPFFVAPTGVLHARALLFGA